MYWAGCVAVGCQLVGFNGICCTWVIVLGAEDEGIVVIVTPRHAATVVSGMYVLLARGEAAVYGGSWPDFGDGTDIGISPAFTRPTGLSCEGADGGDICWWWELGLWGERPVNISAICREKTICSCDDIYLRLRTKINSNVLVSLRICVSL